MNTRLNVNKVLVNLIESATDAKAHYQIWWALANQARPRLVRQMNRFPDFFIATQRAHFDSMIVHLAHLFDKQPAATSIEKYLSVARSILPVMDLSSLGKQLALMHPVIKAVLTIRNNVVAHKNADLTDRQVFKKAGVTPNQVRDLINSAVAVVEYLRRAKEWTSGVFESDRYAQATLRLIEALKK